MKKKIIAFILAIPLIANAQTREMNQDSTSIVPNAQMMSIQNSTNTTTSTSTSAAITNGRCGSDNASISFVTPTALCTSGIPTAVTLTGNTYSWSCVGSSNGSNASCSSTRAYYGSCGSDNGQTLSTTPTNLCNAGVASAVTSNGTTYNWTCKGNTGPAVSCSANRQSGCTDFAPGSSWSGFTYAEVAAAFNLSPVIPEGTIVERNYSSTSNSETFIRYICTGGTWKSLGLFNGSIGGFSIF